MGLNTMGLNTMGLNTMGLNTMGLNTMVSGSSWPRCSTPTNRSAWR